MTQQATEAAAPLVKLPELDQVTGFTADEKRERKVVQQYTAHQKQCDQHHENRVRCDDGPVAETRLFVGRSAHPLC